MPPIRDFPNSSRQARTVRLPSSPPITLLLFFNVLLRVISFSPASGPTFWRGLRAPPGPNAPTQFTDAGAIPDPITSCLVLHLRSSTNRLSLSTQCKLFDSLPFYPRTSFPVTLRFFLPFILLSSFLGSQARRRGVLFCGRTWGMNLREGFFNLTLWRRQG
jgi:hypothetical protein